MDWDSNPQSTTLKASTLTITPCMWYIVIGINVYKYVNVSMSYIIINISEGSFSQITNILSDLRYIQQYFSYLVSIYRVPGENNGQAASNW